MPGTLTAALSTLQRQLGTGSPYLLGPSSLTGTNLFAILQTYLGITDSVAVTSSQGPVQAGTALQLTGTVSVLGLTGAAIVITFVDTAGGTGTDGNSDVRALDFVATITPTSGWRPSTSFPALAGTVFDQLTLTAPTFVLASLEGLSITAGGATFPALYGLSLAATATLTGPLAPLASLTGTGATTPQALYGPIAFTSDATPLPCLALALPRYTLTLPPFPTPILLSTVVRSMPGAAGALSAAVTLTAPMAIAGVGSVGLTGTLPATGPITLSYGFPATATTLDALAWWGSATPVGNALPAAIRGYAYSLANASLTLAASPAAVSATRFDLVTPDVWQLGTGVSLKQIAVSIQQTGASAISASIRGYVPVPDTAQPGAQVGVTVSATSDAGFPSPITFSLTTRLAGIVSPDLPALVGFLYPAWAASLPADLTALGSKITVAGFGVSQSDTAVGLSASFTATDATAAWTLAATTPQPLALRAISIALTAPAGGAASAVVSGTIALGSPPTAYRFATTVTGTSFATYGFALQTGQGLKLGDLSSSLCGSATPGWIAPLPLDSGSLTLTPGTSSSIVGAFHVQPDTFGVPVPTGGQSPSTLGSFNGLAIGYSGSAATATLSATWTVGPPGNGNYVGSLAYPYTSFSIGGGNALPIPQRVTPSGSPDPDRAAEIAGYVIAAAGSAITIGVIGSAIWAAFQAGGYAAVAPAANAVASTIWRRIVGGLLARARLLAGGLGVTILGLTTTTIALLVRHGSDDQVTPAMNVSVLKSERNASAYDAGDAVSQAYSLNGAQLAPALAPTYAAPDTAAALKRLFPASYANARAMIAQLMAADVYGSSLTPTQMATALAASGYAASEVAPALLAQYGATVGTAATMAPVLQNGWQAAGLTLALADMIAALAACAFAAAATVQVVLPLYSGTALAAFGTAVVTGYQPVAPVSAMQLAIGLAAAGQTAAAAQPAVQAALPTLTSDQWTAIAAVAFAGGQAALLALAMAQHAAGATPTAAAQAIVAAQPAVALNALAGNLYAIFSAPNQAPAALATAIKQAFGGNPPTPQAMSQAIALAQAPIMQDALQMITLLAAAGYPVATVAAAVAQGFPTAAGTAALLAPLLQQGYQAAGQQLAVGDMAAGLAAAGFSVIQSAPAIVPLYTTATLSTVASAIVAAWASGAAPTSALQLGQGLAAAGQAQLAVGPALRAAMPSLTAAQMTAVLAATYDSAQAAAALLAEQQHAAGKTATEAAQAIVAAAPQIDTTLLAGVLYAVFSPPNLVMTALAQPVAAGLGAALSVTALGQALPICYYPAASTALSIAQALVGAVTGVTAVQVATALKVDGFARGDALAALTGAGFSQAQATQAIIQVYGGSALKLIGNVSNVTIPSAQAPSPGTSDFSLELWMQASTGQGGVLLQHQAGAGQHNAGFNLQVTPGGTIAFTLLGAGGSSVSYQNNAPVTLYDGKPHYIAATRQTTAGTTTIMLYLDGQPIAGSPGTSAAIDVTATAPLTIGLASTSPSGGYALVGLVWNVCLWNCALSAATVGQHQAAGTIAAPQPNLAGFWPMTDGGTDDQSGNGQNGTLGGGAAIVQPAGD